MKTLKILYSITALLAFSALTFSCSSENEENLNNGNEELKPISVYLSSDEDDMNTRTSLSITQYYVKYGWYSDDIVWAYSPSKKYYNKLIPIEDNSAKYGNTEMHFKSEGTVDYTNNERLILLYSGDKTGNTSNPGTGETGMTEASLSFSRAESDNKMVFIYGNKTKPYSDDGNSFSIKGISGVVTDGVFTKKKLNLVNVMPKLCFNIPAINEKDVTELSKLDYKIIVELKTSENSNAGYPDKVKLKLNTSVNDDDYPVFLYQENNAIEWGDPLKVKYEANGTEINKKSSSLWKAETNSKDVDNYRGYIFIPFPVIESYAKLTVRVRIEYNGTENLSDDIKSLCKTYTFEKENITFEANNKKGILYADNTSKIYDIGSIWTRTSSEPSAAPARIKAGNGWVVTENE